MTTTTNFSSHGTVSLTRRGRLFLFGIPTMLGVVALLAALMVMAASVLNQAQASVSAEPGIEAVEVEVAPGDTLWSVAAEASAEEDIRAVMAQIAEVNNLHGSELQPGETLYVPAE